MFRDTASDSRAVVLSPGALFVGTSSLSPVNVARVSTADGIAKSDQGVPLVSEDVRMSVSLRRRGTDVIDGIIVRGVSPPLFAMRPGIQVVEGRMFNRRAREVIVGRRAQAEFAGTAVGDGIRYEDKSFEIVGTFESGDWYESGFICDADVLLRATGRRSVHSVLAELVNPTAIGALNAALGFYDFQVLPEPAYYGRLDAAWSARLGLVSRIVVAVTALCAGFCVFALTNVALARRRDTMAASRGNGTSASVVVFSIQAQVALAAALGGLLGVGVAWALFGGDLMTAGYSDSSVVYEMAFSFRTVFVGVAWAVAIGVIGSILPAVYAASLVRR